MRRTIQGIDKRILKVRLNLLFQEEFLSLEEDWSLKGNWSMSKMRLNLLFQEEILSLEEDWSLEGNWSVC